MRIITLTLIGSAICLYLLPLWSVIVLGIVIGMMDKRKFASFLLPFVGIAVICGLNLLLVESNASVSLIDFTNDVMQGIGSNAVIVLYILPFSLLGGLSGLFGNLIYSFKKQ